MSINPSATTLTSIKLVSAATLVRDWRLGQRLQVIALTSSDRGQVRLQTANGIVDADTRVPVTAGQRLFLQVISPGDKPVLKVLDRSPPQNPNTLGLALRTLLPRQAGLPPLLANVTEIALTPTGNQLSAPLLEAVRELFKRLPDVRQVSTAKGLQQALQNSGLFLEAKLANGLHLGAQFKLIEDFKASLLKLRHALRKEGSPSTSNPVQPDSKQTALDRSPPPFRGAMPQPQSNPPPSVSARSSLAQIDKVLANQVQGSLARLQLSQIASVSLDNTQEVDWLLELPVRRNDQVDVMALRIEQHKSKGSNEHTDAWSATLAFEFEELGPVHAKVVVRAQQVAVDLWAEQAAAVDLFKGYFNLLNEFLMHEGLTVTRLGCHHGRMPDPAQHHTRPMLVSTSV